MLESPNIWLVLVLFIFINNDLSEAKKGHIGEERGDGRGWYGGSRGKYSRLPNKRRLSNKHRPWKNWQK